MCCQNYVLRVFIYFFLIFHIVTPVHSMGRRYDMNTESQKLYGEDFKTVIGHFRRTPDYLKILNDKFSDLKVYLEEMGLQVLHYYSGKMSKKVGDKVGITRAGLDMSTAPTMYYHAFNARRQNGEETTTTTAAPAEEVEEEENPAVKELDKYRVFKNELTVAERNNFKDLGFEFAGQVIHTIIENMGPTDSPQKSTKMLRGDPEPKNYGTTFEHHHTHQVTQEQGDSGFDDRDTTPETYRYRGYHRQKPPILSRRKNSLTQLFSRYNI